MSRSLILSPLGSTTCVLLATQAATVGMRVLRLGAPSGLPDDVSRHQLIHVYGGPQWAGAFASHLDLALLEPPDGWLPALPRHFTQRCIQLATAADAAVAPGSFFVKPPRDKTFEPAVHTTSSFRELSRRTGLAPEEPVLLAEPVDFGREYRLMVLEGQVHTGSRYLSWGALDPVPLAEDPHEAEVLAFANELLADQADAVPAAFTLDVGYAHNRVTGEQGWAVVEANMAWFSNIYACDPGRALDVVVRSAGPADLCSRVELEFVRPAGPPSR